jgi:hypothetical protein
MPAEEVRFVLFPRLVVELKVVLCELYLPCCCAGADFVGLGPICKVLVVCPNDDWEDRAAQ